MNPNDISLFLETLAHSKPNLKILELGSWTTSPSESIVRSLTLEGGRTLWSKYTFAPRTFGPGQDAQSKLPNMEIISLDVNDDPLEQGFSENEYDLIVASNSVHMSKNIEASLSHIKKLLRPGGYLVLQELCPTSKWINLIFGIHPSWWCGIEDGRPDEPYIDTQSWHEKLTAAVYAGSYTAVADSPEPSQLNSITIARPCEVLSPKSNQITLLCRDKTTDPGPILQDLQSAGYEVTIRTIHDGPLPGQDAIAILDREGPFFENIDEQSYDAFKQFVTRLDTSGVLWVTEPCQLQCRDPRYAQVIGTARTLRSELLIDFATCEVDDLAASSKQVIEVLAKFQRRSSDDILRPDFEYAIHDGIVNVSRFYPFELSSELLVSEPYGRAVLDVEIPGRLNTLHWSRKPALPPLQADEVEVEMYSTCLNFRDVLVAMKIVELPERVLGLEGAGVVRQVGSQVKNLRVGDRVAMIERATFASVVNTLDIRCVKIPDGLSFNEAATMLVPYVTAIHSLKNIGGLEKGQSVLIHSACGGVGLAALQYAQMVEAEIYVTVGSEEKVQYLLDNFNLPRERILNSRDESFVEGIMRETQNNGVDLVLNSLSGELLHATWRCVAPFGKLVEIGKRDLIGFGKLDMNPFLANRSYCCVDVDAFQPMALHKLLNYIMEMYQQGRISSIKPVKVFDAKSTCEAFRYMQRGVHIGRICVSMRESPQVTSLSEDMILNRPQVLQLHPSASYLLVGGLGGLGRSVSTWMVENGARELIHLSRTAGTPADEVFVAELNSMGCQVQLVRGSVTNLDDVTKAIQSAKYPLKGILQMSMVLRDENFFNMTFDHWNTAVSPKIQGTWNLHNAATSTSCDLDFFVLFSSLSGITGQPGQTNYAGANTFLDAFVQYRTSLGLAASAIDIGAVGDVGYISENQGLMQKMAGTGFKALKEQELLDALVLAMLPKKQSTPQLETRGRYFVDPNNFLLGLASTTPLNSPSNRSVWKTDRRMALYHNTAGSDTTGGASNASLKSFISSAKADISVLKTTEAVEFLTQEIGKKLLVLFMRPEEDLDTSMSLVSLGMDSLVGIELCAWWKQVFGFNISVLELLGMGTLVALGQHAADGLIKAIQAERGS